ncbi:MAG: hypothetical protein ABIH59_00650 [archaeon]
MVLKGLKLFLFVITLVFIVLFFSNNVSALNCWQHNNQTGCEAETSFSCRWQGESWGGWCEQINCWSLWSQTDCENQTLHTEIGKNCTWNIPDTSWGWCETKSCWSFEETNSTYCEDSTAHGLNCEWRNQCHGYNPNTNCWGLTTETTCENVTGCDWGECHEAATCSDYWQNSTICLANTGSRGYNCSWNSQYSYCYEASCWDYSGTNSSYCTTQGAAMNCTWIDNYYVQDSCEEPSCYHYDKTNQTVCESNSVGLECSWDGEWCMMNGCWNNNNQTLCNAKDSCIWATSTGDGWCEELMCWSWDGWQGGNEAQCVNNTNGLNCAWDSNCPGGGCCYPNVTIGCSNFTTDYECMDTYYCWWMWNDWNNISAGGACQNPDFVGIGEDDIFNEFNPGCYIFDMNSTDCNVIIGCNYTGNQCNPVDTNSSVVNVTVAYINENGLNCTMINSSRLCNDLPALSTCCEWSLGACTSKLDKSCWQEADREQEELGGIKACEDVSMQTSDSGSAQSLCEQIAGSPLYMPCIWENTTKTCKFKAADVFGNRSQSFALIDNKKNCNAAGGKWIKEWYCEGNKSIPTGRCEQKGKNDEINCDKACFACEYQFSGAPHNSTAAAKEYCYDSKLGYCKFTADATAPNGFGFCKAKEEFKKGIATDCKTECGSCTYTGNAYAPTYSDAMPPAQPTYDVCNTPKCYCEHASEYNNVTCKWVVDSTNEIGGYCVGSSQKTCANACDRCYSRTDCANTGRSSFNATGSCSWSNSDSETDGTCSKNSGGDGVSEVCWDGIDNDNDNAIDCADSGCYADSFCGFVSGDCFGWPDETSCVEAQLTDGKNCTWVTDPWGSWCDFPGSACWKYDGNESGCGNDTNCEWSAGFGEGWCEQDWSVGQDCYNLWTEAACGTGSNCTWTNDTWCDGDGADNDWCNTQGGWCDPDSFAPKNCWQYDGDESTCNSTTGCYYETPWCMEQGCWNYDDNQIECDIASGCSWENYEWQSCQVDWGANCWQFNSSTCAVNNCTWRTDDYNPIGWCDNIFSACWDLTEATCDANSNCFWNDWMWNWQTQSQGMCDAICFNNSLTESQCGDLSGCSWSSGWCQSDQFSDSEFSCWNYDDNQTVCDNETACRWKNPGWCNPIGFSGGDAIGGAGGGSQTGMECWKYDGNESACINSTLIGMGCSWMDEFRPFCEPDWGTDCWKYYDNTTVTGGYVCGNVTGCYWDSTAGFCANNFDKCWSDSTLNSNNDSCNANQYCNWSSFGGWEHCEPSCFAATTEETCTGSCRWMSGWCNSPGMYNMFIGMQIGPPMNIIGDDCNSEISSDFLDLCEVGMKDMDDTYGFGSKMANFANAGICNNQKIGFTNTFGNGNETVKYFVYLDTDGSTTGSCALSNDASAVGYEFFFKYASVYNATLNKATETFTAKKCGANGWTVADISLNAWKEKICGEIQGPMIAVKKSDLEKFPTLYNSEVDMRVYVASAGSSNNATSPSDTAGPGWVTPGAIDFPIQGFFDWGADSATFEDILLGGGYVQYEDCFNLVDDDDDSLIDCADWDCEFAPHCSSSGINAVGYVDTSMPRITGVKVEEYTDSALVMYNTDKPTNGTLYFWNNDSSCTSSPLNLNRTIYDIGINLDNVRAHKLWHYAKIYNDSGIYSLNYTLSTDTTYYYKLKVCDSSGKCSTSACSSFRTAESIAKCGFCNFVTIISAPTGWDVNYDLNTDGIYEHLQGRMCGPKAGMKANYTSGRQANIKLNNSDGAQMLFLNVSLTKTGLTGDTRTISTEGELIFNDTLTDSSGNAVGLVGMLAQTRDKIVNNLHPEICQIRIPSDDCSQLWHCDNNGDNCGRVDNATINPATGTADGTACIWTIPFCDF